MIKQFSLLFIILITFKTNAMSEKTNEELIIHKNKNGFEVAHKKCQKLEATYSYESDTADLTTLDNIIIHANCDKEPKRYVSFGQAGETFKTLEEISKKYNDIYNLNVRMISQKRSTMFYLPEKKYLKENNILHMSVNKPGGDSDYRWYIKKQCGIKLFALEINVMMPHTKEYEAKITSGEEIIPPEEKKIIDSFRCLN